MANEKNKTTVASVSTISALYAGTIALTAYWVMIIFKAAYSGFSDFLNWYAPVGPLMSLFILALAIFGFSYWWLDRSLAGVSEKKLKQHQSQAVQLFIVAVVAVLFMTFPPIFEPIAELLHG